jgi:hypothetical protein
VFGKDELNLNYFYQSFNRNLYLSENRIDAFVEEIIVIEAIYRPMTEYVSEYYTTNGKVENIRVNEEPFDVHERVGANTASTKIIDPALQPGETITVKKTANYVGVFPENIEWLSVLVAQPIGAIDYWVHFNGDDLPAQVWEHHYNTAAGRHYETFPITLENNVAHIRVNNPNMNKSYCIRWKWD